MSAIDDFVRAFQAIGVAYNLLAQQDLVALRDICDRAESLGPALMPTEYREGAERLRVKQKLLAAAMEFVAECREVEIAVRGEATDV